MKAIKVSAFRERDCAATCIGMPSKGVLTIDNGSCVMVQDSHWSSGRHEAKGVDLPAGFVASLAQRGKKGAAVGVIAEDLRATVAPAPEEVNGAGALDAPRAEHGGIASRSGRI